MQIQLNKRQLTTLHEALHASIQHEESIISAYEIESFYSNAVQHGNIHVHKSNLQVVKNCEKAIKRYKELYSAIFDV